MINRKSFHINWLLLCLVPFMGIAKDKGPTLFVYGNSVEAFAAAVQAARSNVPTLWVVNADVFTAELSQKQLSITSNDYMDAGIWLDLLMKISKSKTKNDSTAIAAKRGMNPDVVRHALEEIARAETKLSIMMNVSVSKLAMRKKYIDVRLSNKKKYSFRAVVDATANQALAAFVAGQDSLQKADKLQRVQAIPEPLQRTIVALGAHNTHAMALTFAHILQYRIGHVFFTSLLPADDSEYIPLRFTVGQAVGAAAAYCAFFKTNYTRIDVRKLQSELQVFDARLLPAKNISISDPNFKSLQKVYLAGLLPLQNADLGYSLDTGGTVSVAAVRPVFHQLYSRSKIWFAENQAETFRLKDILSLIRFVSFRGEEIDAQVEKEWSQGLKFKGVFDLEHPVTPYEFAVLIDRYANPYTKAINNKGEFVN